jgi:small nuclear ribonucleoprotein (snRNP)-like protein
VLPLQLVCEAKIVRLHATSSCFESGQASADRMRPYCVNVVVCAVSKPSTVHALAYHLYTILYVQLVELKNGEAYNGKMEACDTWMNIHLREVICTSKNGDKFWRIKSVFIRGNTIKYVRVPDETLGRAAEERPQKAGAVPLFHTRTVINGSYPRNSILNHFCNCVFTIV